MRFGSRSAQVRFACVALLGLLAALALTLSLDAQRPTPAPLDEIAASEPFPMPPELRDVRLMRQTDEQKTLKSAGCLNCHRGVGDPHAADTVRLGCVDCHGGDP